MNRVDIDSVLSQMRALQIEAKAIPAPTADLTAPQADFSTVLKQSIDSVNATQTKAAAAAQSFERGEPGVDLPEVMIELQKARVSFQAMTEVRNRLVSAYKDIMNMPM